MTPRRAFELLAMVCGRVVAQIICWVLMLALLGLGAMAFRWVNGVLPWKIDPLAFLWLLAMLAIVFVAYRVLSNADLDD